MPIGRAEARARSTGRASSNSWPRGQIKRSHCHASHGRRFCLIMANFVPDSAAERPATAFQNSEPRSSPIEIHTVIGIATLAIGLYILVDGAASMPAVM